MNNSIDFNSLKKVTSANSRVNYDLRYSQKTGKFTVSDRAFDKYDLNNNGFDVFEDTSGNVVLMIQSNEDALIFGGKSTSENKSSSFSANGLVDRLHITTTTEWNFNAIEHEGDIYLTLEALENDSAEEVTETPETEYSI